MSRGTQDTLVEFYFSPTGMLPSVLGLSRPLRLSLPSTDESPTTPVSMFDIRCSIFDCLPFFQVLALMHVLKKLTYTRNTNIETRTSIRVWALPVSLAATQGIDYSFSSSGYLDVSVPRVVSLNLWIQLRVAEHYFGWVAPFGYLRI